MSITITDDLMTSTETPYTARWSADAAGDAQGAWVVSWLPQRLLTRNQAVTAMTLAQCVAIHDASAYPWRQHIEGWAAELGISPGRAIDLLTAVA